MAQAQIIDETPTIVGMLPHGIDQELAQDTVARIRDIFKRKGGGARVRSLRFVPSSLIQTGEHEFQFVVNAAVDPLRSKGGTVLSRAKVVDSVVTVGLGHEHLVKHVLVPFLEPEPT